MGDIIVTMPKSRGGLRHLEEKIEFTQDPDGYAWWWVKNATRLTPDDSVLVVCDGKLRGRFSIKWIVDAVEADANRVAVRFRNRDGTIFLNESNGVYSIRQRVERVDGSTILTTPDETFSEDDIQTLLYPDQWYRDGMQTIFFDEWFGSLEQPEMKGFQGFRYAGNGGIQV